MTKLAPASALLSLGLLVLLTGCGAAFNADPSVQTSTSAFSIAGQVHGGRQPIANAEVFVFAAGTSGDAGPGIAPASGNASTSLIRSANSSGYNATVGGYYVLTDANGNFSLSADYSCTTGQQLYLYSLGGKPDGVNTNSVIGLLAALGPCGPTVSNLTGIHMNEATTIAAAYALAGFASDATHVSSNGSALALTGIANAFANAGQLVSLTQQPATTALATTSTGGIVPQKLINSLANSLAACVNSTGSGSAQCTGLFTDTKDFRGDAPTDTASAAINIAHSPGASVNAIFTLPGPIGYPFTPNLGANAPNDFTAGIIFTASLSGPAGIAIDAFGDAWVAGSSSNNLVEFNPLGGTASITTTDMSEPVGVAIDSNGKVWVANLNSVARVTPGGSIANYTTSSLNGPDYLAVDTSNNIWVTNYNDNSTAEIDNNGNNVGSSPYFASSQSQPRNIAIDHNNTVWIAEAGSGSYFHITNGGGTGTNYTTSNGIYSVAVDSSNNAWFGGEGSSNGVILRVNSSGSVTATCGNTGFSYVEAVAIDGAGNVWGGSTDNDGGHPAINECSSAGSPLSPTTGYLGGSVIAPFNIAVDGSGDVWYANVNATSTDNNGTGTTVIELIGAATPVVTPISVNYPGKSTTGLGVRP